jgi:hypothetical protein
MSASPLLDPLQQLADSHPADHDLLPIIDGRVSLVLSDEMIAGTLRSWRPEAEIRLDRQAPLPLPSRGRLQFMTAVGVLHYRGALSTHATERGHCVRFKPHGSPQLLLARRRLSAELRVPVAVWREDGTALDVFTATVSEGALLLADRTNLQLGEMVQLRIDLDVFAEPISAIATVVRISEAGRATVHYTQMSASARERLGWRIFDHLLSLRRPPRS